MRLALPSVLCLAPPVASAQRPATVEPHYLATTWQTEEGVPDSTATAMVQTPDGYLWLGTFNGLARFDGLRWTSFDRANTPELPNSEIINLHLDRAGRLWISTTLGMASVENGRWRVFRHGQGWSGNYARGFAEGRDGTLYVATFDGLLLRFTGDGFETLPPPPGNPTDDGVFPHVAADGTLWAFTPGFLGRFANGAWRSVIPIHEWDEGEISIGSARDGGLWVLSRRRIRKFAGETLVFEAPGTGDKAGTWQMYEDSAGTLWVCNFNGLDRFTAAEGWQRLSVRTGLAYDNVRFVFEDREGNLWVGTNGGGVQRLRRRLFTAWGVKQGLAEPVVRSVAVDRRGRIVFGTQGQGIGRIDGTNVERLPAGTDSPYVYAVLSDRRERLWIGTWASGLWVVEGGRSRRYGNEAGSPFAGRDALVVFSLFEDSRGRIWIGSNQGLTRFEDGRFETYPLESATPLHSVRCIAEDRRTGAIWAGHHTGGVYVLEDGRLRPAPGAEALRADQVSSLLVDPDGTVWIGTEDRGLACLRKGRLHRISREQGLSARIGAVVDDGKGSLWLGSNHGVLRVRRPDLEDVVEGRRSALAPQIFGMQDGVPTHACSLGVQPAAAIDASGRLWFATNKGVAMVDPGGLKLNTVPPPVVIQDVRLDCVAARVDAPFRTTAGWAPPARVRVPPGTRRIEIEAAGLSYSVPEKVRFRYRVEGLEDPWTDLGSRRTVYLQNLPPGTYPVYVEAANNDGVWSAAAARVDLEVVPYFYQTYWFSALAVGLVIAAAVGVHRRRVRGFAARQRELEERVAEALAHVRTLRGLLPVCAWCKKIRDDDGYWSQMETYIRAHSEASFSHSICPECLKAIWPQYAGLLTQDEEPE